MIGVVIVTHGRLAHEFRAALEHVVGPQEQIETISIGPDDDLDVRRSDMLTALARVDSGERRGRAHRHVRRHAVEPRHLGHGAVECRGDRRRQSADAGEARERAAASAGCEEAITQAQEAGRKYISVASQILAAN